MKDARHVPEAPKRGQRSSQEGSEDGRGLYAAETVSTPASTLQENNQDDTR